MRACAEPCCTDSPDSLTFAEPCCTELPDSPTFAELCCADSPDSPTLAKPCCADSPDSPTHTLASFWEKFDSPQQICASNARVSRIWREWPLLILELLQKLQKEKFFLMSLVDFKTWLRRMQFEMLKLILNIRKKWQHQVIELINDVQSEIPQLFGGRFTDLNRPLFIMIVIHWQ